VALFRLIKIGIHGVDSSEPTGSGAPLRMNTA
jgi:hypothetical protein